MAFSPLGRFALSTVLAERQGVTDPQARTRLAFLGGLFGSSTTGLVLTTVLARREAEAAAAPDGIPVSDSKPIPNLTGKSFDIAQQILEAMELDLQVERADVVDFENPIGRVIGQDPEVPNRISAGSTVTLFVSEGFPLPDVENESLEKALEKLGTELGLRVGQEREPSEEVNEGNIIRQSPKANTPVSRDDEVTLTVSEGRPVVKVPDLIGVIFQEARDTLQDLDLRMERIVEADQMDETKDIYEVVAQDPPPDDEVDPRTRVTLTVNPLVMPSVIGDPFQEARERLQDLDLRVRRVNAAQHNRQRNEGDVVEQDPAADEKIPPESLVTLTVNPPPAPGPG